MIKKTIGMAILLASFMQVNFANEWHTVRTPTKGKTEIYGSYANGCFAGGITIPTKADGYEQVRPSRNRNYGAQVVDKFVDNVNEFGIKTNRVIILGDISQPRGGPANFGHASHQTGLDIDIWLEDRTNHLSKREVEKLSTPSVVNHRTGKINQHWKSYFRELYYLAATYSETDRIFVNPVIKLHLCQTEKDTKWLNKLRPWNGHDAHMHVRLKCPKDSKGCISQDPVPKGDGCDADLENWVNDQIEWTINPKKKQYSGNKTKKTLPLQCKNILNE